MTQKGRAEGQGAGWWERGHSWCAHHFITCFLLDISRQSRQENPIWPTVRGDAHPVVIFKGWLFCQVGSNSNIEAKWFFKRRKQYVISSLLMKNRFCQPEKKLSSLILKNKEKWTSRSEQRWHWLQTNEAQGCCYNGPAGCSCQLRHGRCSPYFFTNNLVLLTHCPKVSIKSNQMPLLL